MPVKLIKCGMVIAAIQIVCTLNAAAQRMLPSADVRELSGKSINTSTISNNGKPMILFIWEVTCQPCIAEFMAVSRKYDSWKNETGVKIVAISVDDSRSSGRVLPLVRGKGWEFEFYTDANQAFKRAMNVTYCPYVFVVNGKGEICWQKSGYAPGDETLIYSIVKKVLKGEKPD
ncbi:MAG: TlpA family protein disulfide reductase [Taibaiella sp.]|nr:TlpA family protein disulfide reductase [Taibaiella sp.]